MYVETDRYYNPVVPRENRFCFHCKIKNWIDKFQLGHISTLKKWLVRKINGGRGCLKYVVNDIHEPDVYSKTYTQRVANNRI